MRVTQQKTRQALLTVGVDLDPNELPEKLQLFNDLGEPLSIPIGHRRIVTFTTASLLAAEDTGDPETREPGGGESGSIELAAGVLLTHITVDKPARVRFYASAAYRDADELRLRTQDPKDYPERDAAIDHGCLSEFLLISVLDLENIPADYLASADGLSLIYYRVDNFDLTDGTVTVDLTIKDVEQ